MSTPRPRGCLLQADAARTLAYVRLAIVRVRAERFAPSPCDFYHLLGIVPIGEEGAWVRRVEAEPQAAT